WRAKTYPPRPGGSTPTAPGLEGDLHADVEDPLGERRLVPLRERPLIELDRRADADLPRELRLVAGPDRPAESGLVHVEELRVVEGLSAERHAGATLEPEPAVLDRVELDHAHEGGEVLRAVEVIIGPGEELAAEAHVRVGGAAESEGEGRLGEGLAVAGLVGELVGFTAGAQPTADVEAAADRFGRELDQSPIASAL